MQRREYTIYEHPCLECGAILSSAWNLKRHKLKKKHFASISTFNENNIAPSFESSPASSNTDSVANTPIMPFPEMPFPEISFPEIPFPEMPLKSTTFENQGRSFHWDQSLMIPNFSAFENSSENMAWSNQDTGRQWNQSLLDPTIPISERPFEHTALSNQDVGLEWNQSLITPTISTSEMPFGNTALSNQGTSFGWDTSLITSAIPIPELLHENTALSNQDISLEWNTSLITPAISIPEVPSENSTLLNQETRLPWDPALMSSVLDLSLSLQSSSNIQSNISQPDVLGVSDCSSSAYWDPAITSPSLDFLSEGITLFYPSENTQCITGSTFFGSDLGSISSSSANHRDSNTFEEQTLADSNNSLFESESEQNSMSQSRIPTSSQDQSFDSFDDSQSTRKRKRFLMTDRMLRARICSSISKYEVKMSRIKPD